MHKDGKIGIQLGLKLRSRYLQSQVIAGVRTQSIFRKVSRRFWV